MVTAQEKLSWILLYAVVVGFFLGFVYDIVRLRRLVSEKRRSCGSLSVLGRRIEYILVFAEDILFAFICSVVLCIFIYYIIYPNMPFCQHNTDYIKTKNL